MITDSRYRVLIYIAGLMLIAAVAEFTMGRQLWGTSGEPGLWSGDINSSHNSQYVADPYSFTHITHGLAFYGLLALIFPKTAVLRRLVMAVGLESGWEILENTDMVIERYRAETISLNYYGDSVVNSLSDIVACMSGFLLASRLPKRATIGLAILLEVGLLLWTRDNLTLNIIMLISPSRAIRMWQAG